MTFTITIPACHPTRMADGVARIRDMIKGTMGMTDTMAGTINEKAL
jgi:hypothetical protein